jgi:signal transduction histidine kinase/DNA-binding response OmpR family regulator
MNKKCLLLSIILLISVGLFAQKVILSPTTHVVNLSPNTFIFEDTLSNVSFQEIQKKKFIPYTKKNYVFPFTDHTFWVKINLENQSPLQKDWVFTWDNPMVENVFFYIPQPNGTFKEIKEGCFVYKPQNKFIENLINIPFSTFDGKSHTFYVKIQSQRAHYANFVLYQKNDFEDYNLSHLKRASMINGLFILRGIYLLLLAFFVIKDKTFRQYSMVTIFRSLGFWGFLGILGAMFTKNTTLAMHINQQFYYLMPLWFTLILPSFLEINRFPPYVRILLKIIPLLCVIFCANIFFFYQWYWLKLATMLLVFNNLFIIFLYAVSFIKKYKVEWAYSIPILLGIGSNIHYPARLLGMSDFPGSTIIAYVFFVSEILFFGLFLGRIIRAYEKNKIKTQSELIFNQEQASKLQALDVAKTNFFANISHEFRTPLTLILGPTQDLIKENPSKMVYQIIQRNASRLLELTNQLLDLSKLDAGQLKVDLEEIELTKYFRTLVSSFSSLAVSKDITFEFNQNKATVFGKIDKDKVEKIIINVLSNAFKFTKKGGIVSININYNKTLLIEIHDSGIGISKDNLKNIFSRFYQIDDNKNRKYEGTGIGLALVLELVNVLKGTINVESIENKGTSFFINLPIAFMRNLDETEQKSISHPSIQQTKKEISPKNQADIVKEHLFLPNDNILLIVDDNEDIRSYIRTIFEHEYKIIEAVNGIDGLLKASKTIPNLIISDLMMPEMDGFEFCRILKSEEKTSHIPVVMLTAKANIESRIEGLELGADDYLLKPFNSTEIQVRVKNLIEKQEKLRLFYTQKIIELKPNEVKVNSKEEVFLRKAITIIEQNFADNQFSVEQFSVEMDMSQSQLVRKLKALTNLTGNEFIRDFRLQRAAELLKKKAGTISEIAFQVGFENLSYFSKVFQEKFGKLPSEC